MIRQRFGLVASALLASIAMPAAVHAQACPGKGATLTGTLRVERHQHPNGSTFEPWMLQLPGPTCLMVAGLDDRSPPQRLPTIRRVQLGAASDQQTAQLRSLVGKSITIRLDDVFEPHTAWHVGDVVSTEFAIVRP